MTTTLIPPLADLQQLYGDVLGNTAVRSIARWTEDNHDDSCDNERYLAKTLNEGSKFLDGIERVIEGI